MYKMSRMTTFAMKNVAKLYCKIWFKLRCRLFRRIQDLNYQVFDLRDNYANEQSYRKAMVNIPFISKIIEVNDDTEKTSENPWRQRRQRIDGRYRIFNRAGDVKVGGKDPPAFFVACQNVAKKWDFA